MDNSSDEEHGSNDGMEELTGLLDDVCFDTSRSSISRLTANLNICAVCHFAFETYGSLRSHVRKIHRVNNPELKAQIKELQDIPRDDLTQAQKHNLVQLMKTRGYLKHF
jgi:hypothetical protein